MGKKIIYIRIYIMEREMTCWTYDFGDELSTRARGEDDLPEEDKKLYC